MSMCRHCKRYPSNRPRGLCSSCYYTPGVREQYPSTSKFARLGAGAFVNKNVPPPERTDALPGTPEKVTALIQRCAAGYALWHPADASDPLGEATVPRREPDESCGQFAKLTPDGKHVYSLGAIFHATGVRGVRRRGTRFYAALTVCGRGVYLGSYGTLEEAEAAVRAFRERRAG